jgi:23S rRNA (adenine2030-N6)-methyltransferase
VYLAALITLPAVNPMRSYLHAYHAGNRADVHKHALLAILLAYLTQKDKPVSYLDTHAGRGLYDLHAAEARQTGEAQNGVLHLLERFPATHPYRQTVETVRMRYGRQYYPGSPLLAREMLRSCDTLHCAEWHPVEHRLLVAQLGGRSVHIAEEDGFAFALARCPPMPRRGLLLTDPSYEEKADFERIPDWLTTLSHKWNVGILALWYPLLPEAPHRRMVDRLQKAFPDSFHHECLWPTVDPDQRLIGSGMWISRPTFGLAAEAARIHAWLTAP